MLPLTGTSSAAHMKEDLASLNLKLPPELVQAIESIAG
jgi:aryl-alcohol dehydrogenase-like predicted oxidoreductase